MANSRLLGRPQCFEPVLTLISTQSRNWKKSDGTRPKNLDLFKKLDSLINDIEEEYYVKIGFWRLGRKYNKEADKLAKAAAAKARFMRGM